MPEKKYIDNIDLNADNLAAVMNNTNGSMVDTVSSIITTAGVVLAANANRLWAKFTNDSDTVIYLHLGSTSSCALNKGIRLNAAAANSFEINLHNRYTGQITAICSAAAKKLLIQYYNASKS